MAEQFQSVPEEVWGYRAPKVQPVEFEGKLKAEVAQRLADFQVLPEGPEPCRDKSGYERIYVTIPLSLELFDQFLNGNSGYRAQYYQGMENGERFNRLLIDCIAPLILEADHLYHDKFDHLFFKRSLCGKFSKLWYSKDITDPAAQDYLSGLPEVIRVPEWVAYWKTQDKPRKGLLAPQPESPALLLNGTFVRPSTGDIYEQKPDRSRHIHESGWT